jgi:hypothetical protein
VKRGKERIAGTNTKRRQSSLSAARPTYDAIGSVFAYINKSAVHEFFSNSPLPNTNLVIMIF